MEVGSGEGAIHKHIQLFVAIEYFALCAAWLELVEVDVLGCKRIHRRAKLVVFVRGFKFSDVSHVVEAAPEVVKSTNKSSSSLSHTSSRYLLVRGFNSRLELHLTRFQILLRLKTKSSFLVETLRKISGILQFPLRFHWNSFIENVTVVSNRAQLKGLERNAIATVTLQESQPISGQHYRIDAGGFCLIE